jgi:hypothetical protein
MKKLFFLVVFLCFSCTSNTIYKKPKDLIPKDTMTSLIVDMYIASSARNVKNINLEKKVNYMSLVYNKYKIDSIRFQESNTYYTSKYEEYELLIKDVKQRLKDIQKNLQNLKKVNDSLNKEAIKNRDRTFRDSLKTPKNIKEDLILR